MAFEILKILGLVMQIENYNKPSLDALSQYDDGRNLSDYDFNQDGFGPPYDDSNNRKLAYRHRFIAHRYKQVCKHILFVEEVLFFLILSCFKFYL